MQHKPGKPIAAETPDKVHAIPHNADKQILPAIGSSPDRTHRHHRPGTSSEIVALSWDNHAPQPGKYHLRCSSLYLVPCGAKGIALLRHGKDKSLAIWAKDWAGFDPSEPIPASAIIAADLTDWIYQSKPDHIAVDPVLGRIVFPEDQLPKRVHVSYRYGFSADIGGGEYDRKITQPRSAMLYRVGKSEGLHSLNEAIAQWTRDKPRDAVIEITDSKLYAEQIGIELSAGQSLQIRAANRKRPVIRLLDGQTDAPDALDVTLKPGASFTLDGLAIAGRSVRIHGAEKVDAAPVVCSAEVDIRHCTLVPGWGLEHDCEPRRPAEPSLELFNVRARVHIEHSITGSIQVAENEVTADPIPMLIEDSILDATGGKREALGAPGLPVAHAVLTIMRCTVFGIVQVHAITLAENCLFNDCLNVARRQLGCMRFCYVPEGCRTPRRYHCQPDLAQQRVEEALRREAKSKNLPEPMKDEIACAKQWERERMRPQFNSTRYGTPSYCQLAEGCAEEIMRGADDESEMGVFHDLFQPQREANLRARLEEYAPAGTPAGIIHAS